MVKRYEDARCDETAYGSVIVPSLYNYNIYSWMFKVVQSKYYFAIGLTTDFDCTYCDHASKANAYNYGAANASLRDNNFRFHSKYGPKLNGDDKISMIFDAGNGFVSSKINGKSIDGKSTFNSSDVEGMAFSDVKKGEDIAYRMTTATYIFLC